jgi:hypothetical protein
MFKLVQLGSATLLSRQLPTGPLANRSILFIQGENRKNLGKLTEALYDRIQPQKEMVTLKTARIHLMSGEELKNYDRQVATFFHLNLQNANAADRRM